MVEAVKQRGATPTFCELNQALQLECHQPSRIAWLQPPLGLPTAGATSALITVVEHSDSVPLSLSGVSESACQADVTIFGLHLSPDPTVAGALLVFTNEQLQMCVAAAGMAVEPGLYARAAQQLKRLRAIGTRQVSALKLVATGLQIAAGLPMLPVLGGVALAHGIPVRIPDEGSPSTFWTYACHENTPVAWLPTLRPLHYAAVANHQTTITHLERWLMLPVGPDNDEELIRQTVLGIVKTAEYMGLRWRTDPVRAAQYTTLLTAMYGPDHDGYRPAFAVAARAPAEVVPWAEDVIGPSCQIRRQYSVVRSRSQREPSRVVQRRKCCLSNGCISTWGRVLSERQA